MRHAVIELCFHGQPHLGALTGCHVCLEALRCGPTGPPQPGVDVRQIVGEIRAGPGFLQAAVRGVIDRVVLSLVQERVEILDALFRARAGLTESA